MEEQEEEIRSRQGGRDPTRAQWPGSTERVARRGLASESAARSQQISNPHARAQATARTRALHKCTRLLTAAIGMLLTRNRPRPSRARHGPGEPGWTRVSNLAPALARGGLGHARAVSARPRVCLAAIQRRLGGSRQSGGLATASSNGVRRISHGEGAQFPRSSLLDPADFCAGASADAVVTMREPSAAASHPPRPGHPCAQRPAPTQEA